MWDPDAIEMEDYEDIGIFEPGTVLEQSIQGGFIKIVGYTIAGLILMVVGGIVAIFAMVPLGLVDINIYTGSFLISPVGFVIMSATEILLVIPPIYYVRQMNLPLRSIGIKAKAPIKQTILGLGVGMAMIGVNIVVSWLVFSIPGAPQTDDSSLFGGMTVMDVILLSAVMMLVVGPTEEILFRGFMQRRLEIHYHRSKKDYRLRALVITSMIFSITHLDVMGLITRFILGLMLGYLAQRQNYSLLAPSVAHGTNNALVVLLAFMGF